jgi:hypothetical protein
MKTSSWHQENASITNRLILSIISLLTIEERHGTCRNVCHRWKRLAVHPLADIHLYLGIATNEWRSLLPMGYPIPWNFLQSLRLQHSYVPNVFGHNSLSDATYILRQQQHQQQQPVVVTNEHQPVYGKIQEIKQMLFHDLPRLETLTMNGCCFAQWHDLRRLMMVAPNLRHLVLHLDASIECQLVCTLFLTTRQHS